MNLIHVTPRVSEKSYRLVNDQNTYVFDVPTTANKQQIADAIEAQHEVKIDSIKTLVQRGKAMRFGRGKHRFPGTTKRKDTKKAYVTLVEGNSIKVFDEATESELASEESK